MKWRYYNRAMLPDCAPHDDVDITAVKSGELWKNKAGRPLFARWTTNWDCGYETNWWYTVLDAPFDIDSVNAKRRYEIKKGNKFFDARQFCAYDIKEEYLTVDVEAYKAYPAKYRPTVDRDDLYKRLYKNKSEIDKKFFGAFSKETGKLCGYILVNEYEDHVILAKQKAIPQYEKNGINAFLVYSVVEYYNSRLSKDFYICDGERNISHETSFQDFLEKYFGFRKAYCKLNIVFRPSVRWLVPILRVLRKPLKKLDNVGIVHMINSVLTMEELSKGQKEISE